jgi:hydroxymethylglutaryl-CoA synthase
MRVGIIGYGTYVPNAFGSNEFGSINLHDEDCVTLAVAAAQNALEQFGIDPEKIGAIYVGSESHPYAVKPTSSIVAAALGLNKKVFSADIEFACKGGTAALQICYALVKAGMCEYAIAIGSDVAQAAPGDVLEKYVGAGAAAFIVGRGDGVVASIDQTLSITTDTPDFWRRGLQKYPEHMGRFTGEPSYFSHVVEATELILKKTGRKPADFDYVIFHQPNYKFPKLAAKRLGFTAEQVEPGLLVQDIGNTYSANSLLSLAKVLSLASAGKKILLTSYGSGSGCDSFVFRVES